MLVITAVLAILSTAYLLLRYSKRQKPEIIDRETIQMEPPPGARPLFLPDETEMRREARETEAREIARREYASRAAARAAVDNALTRWREHPDKVSTSELLRIAAERGLDGDLARAAGEIIKFHGDASVDGITDGDLAALIDSHIRLLADNERASGEVFWLKQEVARLRSDEPSNR